MSVNYEFRKGIMFIRLNGLLNDDEINKLSLKMDNLIDDIGIRYIVINIKNISCNYKIADLIEDKSKKIRLYGGDLLICSNGIESEVVFKNICSIKNELIAFDMIKI